MGSATFVINGVKDTKNDSRKDKPSDKEGDNGGGDSHDYLFIPRMASEPLKESFHIRIYSLICCMGGRPSGSFQVGAYHRSFRDSACMLFNDHKPL